MKENTAFRNSGAGTDPFIGRFDKGFQVTVGDNRFWCCGPNSDGAAFEWSCGYHGESCVGVCDSVGSGVVMMILEKAAGVTKEGGGLECHRDPGYG